MKKYFFFGVLVISLILINGQGCEVDEKLAKEIAAENVDKIIVCEEPYIRYASGCCLDQNNNKICDNDEKTQDSSDEEPKPIEQKNIEISIAPAGIVGGAQTTLKVNSNGRNLNNEFEVWKVGGSKIKTFSGCNTNFCQGDMVINLRTEPNWVGGYYVLIRGYENNNELARAYFTTISSNPEPTPIPEQPIIIDKVLSDYPSMFIINDKFEGYVVVGTNCAASDTIAQSAILADLQMKAVTKLSNGERIVNPIPSTAAPLDYEVQGNPNLIIIDTKGCNSLISLLGYVKDDAPLKTAIIDIENRDGRYLMLIQGNSAVDTRNAVEAITSGRLSSINKPYAEVKSPSQTIGEYTIG